VSLFVQTSELLRTIQETLEHIETQDPPFQEVSNFYQQTLDLLSQKVTNQQDLVAKIALYQLETYLRKLERDRFAPLTAHLLYITFQEFSELLHNPREGKKIVTELLNFLDQYSVTDEWCLYDQSVLLITKIEEIAEKFDLKPKKAIKSLLEVIRRWKAGTTCVIPFQISLEEIFRPVGVTQVRELEPKIFSLWRLTEAAKKKALSKAHTVGVKTLYDIDPTLQYFELLFSYLHDFSVRELKLPLLEAPIQLRVVYGEESAVSDSVAYFLRQGDQRIVTIFLPPNPEAMTYLPEFAHLIIHEGVPGHATADYLTSQLPTLKPLDYAASLDTCAPFTYLDVSTIFHEGWAVLAQYITSKGLREVFPSIYDWWFYELSLYVSRVLQVMGLLKRNEKETIRSIRPYQLTSYFIGFLIFKAIYDQSPDKAIKALLNASFPIPIDLYESDEWRKLISHSLDGLIKETKSFLSEES